MEFIIRPAKPEDAESIGRLAKELIEYLRSIGDDAEQKFDAKVYLRDGFNSNPAFLELLRNTTAKLSVIFFIISVTMLITQPELCTL
ncbi:MAG: hypothetical protein M3R14_07825 [Acidobacteriota bacterium]|nr:hypothetical protein [Acidobacteriota bacterium]